MKLKHLLENEAPTIADPADAYLYASDQGKRFPKLEPIILKDVGFSYYYAKNVIKGRWPEAEHLFKNDPYYASLYAKNIIKGRWPEAEPYILEDVSLALEYAKNVIKGRWPEAEPFIKRDYLTWNYYLTKFPEARNLSKNVPLVIGDYAFIGIPNTITDEQVLKIINILLPDAKTKINSLGNMRIYDEERIIYNLSKGRLTRINIKDMSETQKLQFLVHINAISRIDDFD
jgi:hypothetical protein